MLAERAYPKGRRRAMRSGSCKVLRLGKLSASGGWFDTLCGVRSEDRFSGASGKTPVGPEPQGNRANMPELPDITVYIEALRARTLGQRLERVRLASPFLLRSVDPPLGNAEGKKVQGTRRLGKRIVLALEEDLFLVLHLMIAGRLHWKDAGSDSKTRPKIPGKQGLAAFDFTSGTLTLTEAGSKKRASLHLAQGGKALSAMDRGGLEGLEAARDAFRRVLVRENHTLKRALTDPSLFSGIGNSYSDEILHRARLSPVKWTRRLDEEEMERLYQASRHTLGEGIERRGNKE